MGDELDNALLYPWYSVQMCHLPGGRAERVGSMYNDPKERQLGTNNEKNGLWMFCVGSAETTDVA